MALKLNVDKTPDHMYTNTKTQKPFLNFEPNGNFNI